jgi:hypothetical protein
MARTREQEAVDWAAVTARALAFLCVRQAKMEGETLLDQASFLERFGIPRAEAAVILGSTDQSLAVMDRRRKVRKKQAKSKGRATTAAKSTKKPPHG